MEERFKSEKEEADALKLKKDEKLRSVQVNREHNLKVREADLKKQEKLVNQRLQKIVEERQEKAKKAQEDSFVRDIEHMNKSGDTNSKEKVRFLTMTINYYLRWKILKSKSASSRSKPASHTTSS